MQPVYACFTDHPFVTEIPGMTPRLRFFRGIDEVTISEIIAVVGGEVHLMGVSGGKDSGALFLWAIHESGLDPARVVVTFSDTGNEHDWTYDQVRQLNEQHPVIWLIPGLDFWGLVRRKGMFPSRKRRFCTQYLKLEPARRFAHMLVSAGYDVTMYSGVRADESAERAQLPDKEWDGYFALPVVRPLLRMKLADVLGIHERYGLKLNPLYAEGASRVGCFPCINSVKAEMRLVPRVAPAQVEKITLMESWLLTALNRTQKGGGTFFHRNTVPPRFRSMDYVTKDGRQIKIALIADVLRWAQWLNKAEQRQQQERANNTLFPEDKFLGCTSSMGHCE